MMVITGLPSANPRPQARSGSPAAFIKFSNTFTHMFHGPCSHYNRRPSSCDTDRTSKA